MKLTTLLGSASLAIFSTMTLATTASAVVIGSTDTGWYDTRGLHIPSNTNYLSGEVGGVRYRNWGIFDLRSLMSSDTITSAVLTVFTAEVRSLTTTETWSLFDVDTDLTDLRNGFGGPSPEGIAVYGDLGSGQTFGSINVSVNQAYQPISVTLNANALTNLNAARGDFWGIGGDCVTCANNEEELLFGFSFAPWSLNLTTQNTQPVPEPLSIWGTLTAGGVILAMKSKRQKKSKKLLGEQA